MANASNKEIGNVWISYMLGELYENWPRRHDFNHLDIAAKTGIAPSKDEEEFFDHLVLWLKDEGYIRLSPQSAPEGNVFDAALTSKGYAILGGTPESLDKPLGSRLKEAALNVGKAGVTEAGQQLVANLVGLTLGAAARGFAS